MGLLDVLQQGREAILRAVSVPTPPNNRGTVGPSNRDTYRQGRLADNYNPFSPESEAQYRELVRRRNTGAITPQERGMLGAIEARRALANTRGRATTPAPIRRNPPKYAGAEHQAMTDAMMEVYPTLDAEDRRALRYGSFIEGLPSMDEVAKKQQNYGKINRTFDYSDRMSQAGYYPAYMDTYERLQAESNARRQNRADLENLINRGATAFQNSRQRGVNFNPEAFVLPNVETQIAVDEFENGRGA
jgi:hypothetical protein